MNGSKKTCETGAKESRRLPSQEVQKCRREIDPVDEELLEATRGENDPVDEELLGAAESVLRTERGETRHRRPNLQITADSTFKDAKQQKKSGDVPTREVMQSLSLRIPTP